MGSVNNHTKSLEHITTILDSVADGVFTVDEEMQITWFNKAAEEITGFSRDEAIGQRCCEIFRSNICFSDCPLQEARSTGKSVVNREVNILDRENREIPISVSASVLYNSNGKAVGGVETFRDLSQIHALKREVENKYTFQDLVSRNPTMQKLFDILPDVAQTDATVLLQGDSGTGKELFAKAIHNLSTRKKSPLITVNCGALPEHLLEAEIFGSKRGAYTGSVEDRPGRIKQAEEGTLFLDEIGDLPLALQVKLLRILENREYQPLGAQKTQKANVRFVTATHRDLEEMVRQGAFRQDLYFRINVVNLKIPNLVDRPEDIPLLLDMALTRFNMAYGKKITSFSTQALLALIDYDFPGNVRELLNIVERSVILCKHSIIDLDSLPPQFSPSKSSYLNYQLPHGRISREAISEILSRHKGNKTKAAKELGINRTTLWRWLKEMDLN